VQHLLQIAQSAREHVGGRRKPAARLAQEIHHISGIETDVLAGFRRPVAKALDRLTAAQNSEDFFELSIPLWCGFNPTYVMDFLSEAKAAGFPPPADMFASGLRNLQKMVARQPSDTIDARRVAYAIYVLTREGVITTNYILNLPRLPRQEARGRVAKRFDRRYLAGALKLLHKDKDAESLIEKVSRSTIRRNENTTIFVSALGANSQYVSVVARQFPARLKKISAAEFEQILRPIGDGEFTPSRPLMRAGIEGVFPRDRAKSSPVDYC